MSLLLHLPDELLVMILNYCSTADHVNISQVCMKLNDITCDRKVVKCVNYTVVSLNKFKIVSYESVSTPKLSGVSFSGW